MWAHLLPSTASLDCGEARSFSTFRAEPTNPRWPRRTLAILRRFRSPQRRPSQVNPYPRSPPNSLPASAGIRLPATGMVPHAMVVEPPPNGFRATSRRSEEQIPGEGSSPKEGFRQEILEGDLRRLLVEIAHTDHRSMKGGAEGSRGTLAGHPLHVCPGSRRDD